MGRHGEGPGVTGAQQHSDQDKHLSDLNTLRGIKILSVHISEAVTPCPE